MDILPFVSCLCVFLLFSFFCIFFFCLLFLVKLLLLFLLGVLHTHAHEEMLECHHGMREEHAALRGTHDFQKFLGRCCSKARTVATVANRLCDTVGATVHLRHDRCQKRRAFRAERPFFGIVVLVAVKPKGFFDIFLLIGNVVFDFCRLAFR